MTVGGSDDHQSERGWTASANQKPPGMFRHLKIQAYSASPISFRLLSIPYSLMKLPMRGP